MKSRVFIAAFFLTTALVLFSFMGTARAEYSFSSDADAVEKAADSVFMLEVYDARNRKLAVGSGFVIFDSSIMVTNYHVIEDGAYLVAISDDTDQFVIDEVCAADKKLDLAILVFHAGKKVQPLDYDASGNLKRSQTVVTIGSPAGLKNTVSIGNISAFFDQNNKNWIQFTAPISAGSSGGALLNDQGKVIGITTATYASAQNVNLAVRVSALVDLYRKWDGKTTRKLSQLTGSGSATLPSAVGGSTNGLPASGTVWITKSGKKYHSNPNCSQMKNPVEIDLLDAIANGYEPCGKCFK
ncbi:MAG: serine protease [Clostridia bacterium]|nr:serine protease [Clostridia bacterium]